MAPQIVSLQKTDRAKRIHLKGWVGRWWEPDQDLLFLKWDLNLHSGSVAIKYTIKDKVLYEDANYYCDDADGLGTPLNTGSLSFYIKEKE